MRLTGSCWRNLAENVRIANNVSADFGKTTDVLKRSYVLQLYNSCYIAFCKCVTRNNIIDSL